MSQRPLVSVCIANYNGMAVIDDCLGSVLSQKGELAVEIIVHDDASTDDSLAYIRSRYPTVKLIESETNVGFCVANNRMAELATGQYLLLLNNDAALFDDALITLYRSALDSGETAILGLPQYDADTDDLLDNGSLLDPFLNPLPNKDLDRHEVGMIMGACLWIPAVLWQEIGGFPEWFGSIGEDLYLCCRARLAGHPVKALGVSGYRHHVGASFGGGKVMKGRLASTYRRRRLSECNKTYVLAVTYPLPVLALLLPVHLSLLMAEGLTLALLSGDRRILTDIYLAVPQSLWTSRARLSALRRAVQVDRRSSMRRFFSTFTLMPHKLRMLFRHGIPTVSR